MWCDGCSDEIDFGAIVDGPNGEWLCYNCSKKPEYQDLEEEDNVPT